MNRVRWALLMLSTVALAWAEHRLRGVLHLAAPTLLLGFALGVSRRADAPETMVAFWWCGLARDAAVGVRLGPGALLFLLLGAATARLRPWTDRSGAASGMATAAAATVVVLFADVFTGSVLPGGHAMRSIVSAALLTAAATPLLARVVARLRIVRIDPAARFLGGGRS